MLANKCEHGADFVFCCKCQYGERSYYEDRKYEDDLVTDLNKSQYVKLEYFYEMGRA